jgi:hypothetical protein
MTRRIQWDKPIPQIYYFPNRPILYPSINPDDIKALEASGKYIAEKKWNGDNCLIYTGQDPSHPTLWSRHKTILKYNPPDPVRDELSMFPKNSVINAELVNSKTKTVKDLFIVHSLLVWKGEPLYGKTWGDARHILESQFFWDKLQTKHVVLSQTWSKGFLDLFNEADGVVIEGIVLKDPTGKLVISTSPIPDVSFLIKLRKPSKKYQY